MKLIEAKTISEHVPHDLLALDVIRRSSCNPAVRICAVGDVGLSGRAVTTATRYGWNSLFADVAPFLRAADISFCNLESPLAGEIAPGKLFAAPTTGAPAFQNAGFNLVHLANNHLGDYGQTGITATLDALCKVGVAVLGAGSDGASARQLVRTDRNGLRIGWLGCGRTLVPQQQTGAHYWEFNEAELLNALIRERPKVDVLLISIHIGLMFLDYPHPEHKAMAERLMEAGADLVLMHHAHVLQGVQVANSGGICCYNLGNFLWDYLEGDVPSTVMLDEQQEGALFLFEVDKKGIASLAVLPTIIDSEYRVRWAIGARGNKILSRLRRISFELETDYQREFDRQRVERNFNHILRDLAFYTSHGNWEYVFKRLTRVRPNHFWQVLKYPFS